VDRIISEEELQLDRGWFPGKRVLDAGCGGGRWSYGLAKLGAHVTAADTNPSALAATRAALEELGAPAEFIRSDLETIDAKLPHDSFDLVWSWGVLHHCTSFSGALRSISNLLKPGGLIHLYLYGRESISLADDVTLFKERLRYNYLRTDEERLEFLTEKARGIDMDVHHAHDLYAPIINRRFNFEEVRDLLQQFGFTHVERTVEHTELWIRAVKGPKAGAIEQYGLPRRKPPYWFQI
jgi:SAM-dependent methyltransferase